MSNERDRSSTGKDAETERLLERLFAHAKPRPTPPPAVTEEIRQALYAEWDAVTSRRVWLRRAGALAATAAAFALVFWTTVGVNPPQSLPMLASVERVQGVIGMRLGDELSTGAVVATGSGQLALRLASGGSLRLGSQTRLQLTGASSAELTAGVVYFDSEGGRASQPFTLTTELGTVRDVGTQFMVRAESEQLEVGVREERVALTRDADQGEATAGDKLIVAAAAPGIRRDSIATFGDRVGVGGAYRRRSTSMATCSVTSSVGSRGRRAVRSCWRMRRPSVWLVRRK
jgi:ferric-dicitrate binding protein FerR (iron transport regulator)